MTSTPQEPERSGPLLLLDGMSLAFRAYYALPDTLATSAGVVTNAVHGFTSMLVYLIREHRPSALAVAFDAPGATFRDEILEDYKAGRAETPWLLPPQFDMIREVMDGAGHPGDRGAGLRGRRRPRHAGHRGGRAPDRGGHRHGRPRQLPARAGPLRARALQQARRQRLRPLRRGGHLRPLRRATVAVRAAGLAARRSLGQPARHSGRGGEDGGQAADQVRRPRRHLHATSTSRRPSCARTWPRTRSWPAPTPASSRSCATCRSTST